MNLGEIIIGQGPACSFCVLTELHGTSTVVATVRPPGGGSTDTVALVRDFGADGKCILVDELPFNLSGEEGIYAGLPDFELAPHIVDLGSEVNVEELAGRVVVALTLDLLLKVRAFLLCENFAPLEIGTIYLRIRDVIVFPEGSVEPFLRRRPEVTLEKSPP